MVAVVGGEGVVFLFSDSASLCHSELEHSFSVFPLRLMIEWKNTKVLVRIFFSSNSDISFIKLNKTAVIRFHVVVIVERLNEVNFFSWSKLFWAASFHNDVKILV